MHKFVTGSNSNSFRNFDRNNYSECVIHLIDPDMDTYDELREDVGDVYEINSSGINRYACDISNYISDQIPELWHQLRYGDMIEDVSRRGEGERSMDGVLVVTRVDQSDGEKLIKCGLEVRELEWNAEREEWVIPSEFTSITKFPFGYHDHKNMVVNNTYARAYVESLSEWSTIPCAIPINLNLDKISLTTKKGMITDNICSLELDGLLFSYISFRFRDVKYLIGTNDTTSVLRYRLNRAYIAGHYGEDALEYLPYEMRNSVRELLMREEIRYEFFFIL